jgi:hypothetical protein
MNKKISPAPDWVSIFTTHPNLDPPGYAEVFIDMIENPKVNQKELKQEEVKKKKRKKSLGRGQNN